MNKEQIKELRYSEGLTQKQLAEILDVSVRTVEAWECGARTPDRRSLKSFKKEFGI